GLFLNEGQKWSERRKAITPAFHFNILEDFLEIFARSADVLIDKFDTDKVVNVPPLFLMCAFDVICETSMGLKMNSQSECNVPYVKAVNNHLKLAVLITGEQVSSTIISSPATPALGESCIN
uniref:Cytochrome P450 n=1 Tax=Megaselia scalaris TaxID=36166 RepID=T1GCV1_MEGSC